MVFQISVNHISKYLLFSILVLCAGMLSQGLATTIQALTLGQLSRLSGRIIQGTVQSKHVVELENRTVWTRYSIYVEEVWKGDQKLSGQSFDLTLQGGELGHGVTHRGQVILGQVNLEEGDRGVFFLERSARGHWVFTGMSQGWFTVVEQGQEEWVIRHLDERHLHHLVHARTFAHVIGHRNYLPLASLKSRVLKGPVKPPSFKGKSPHLLVNPVFKTGARP